MNLKWLEVSCEIPEELSDTVSLFLTQLSGNGVCVENMEVDAFSHDEIKHSPIVTIKSYFGSDQDIDLKISEIKEYLEQLALDYPSFLPVDPVVSTVRTEDWSSSWKAHFKPLKVGRRLLIAPTWEEANPGPDDILLRIDPGMAFGTGGHETTRLCLELLERIMDDLPILTVPDVLDLGTGSGILAMAAVKLGAGRVLALDIDPDAVEVARENIAVNGLEDSIELGTTPLEAVDGKFDVILANILAEELVRLAPDLSRRLTAGGRVILSGILAEKEGLVRKGFKNEQLEYQDTLHDGEWVALLYKKGAV
ncbi:MAG: ribosomal protein L11 methyltransferase [Geobacteraceae bacterium GWC2_48_7]|nr:MAG: ribosomal protein L11 methyltransferase [Geobacteraceae bacterium GWC2_48_7]